MSVTLETLVNALPGAWKTNVSDITRPIGEIVRLKELAVIGSPTHATLVSCTASEVDEILAGKRETVRDLLPQCILVTEPLAQDSVSQLEEEGYSFIVGPPVVQRSVFDTIDTMISENLAYEDRIVSSTMRALTVIARTGGLQGVLSELSRAVDGWAVLLDSHGQVIESVGAARLHIEDAVAVVLNRAVRIRYPDLQVHTVGSTTGDEHAARLVVASRLQSAYRVRAIAAHAAALLALVLRTSALSSGERYGRELMLDTLITQPREARSLLTRWKITSHRMCAFKMSSRTRNIDVERLTSLWLERAGAPPLFVADAGEAYGFAPRASVDDIAAYATDFQTGQGQRVKLGIGDEVAVERLGVTLRQAERAHDAAARTGATVLRFSDLLTVRTTRLPLTPEQRDSVRHMLDPLALSETDHSELLHTLHVFLAHHGSWTPAARELGVHRQTLMNRIQHIEAMLSVSLDNPDHRSLLWIALRANDEH